MNAYRDGNLISRLFDDVVILSDDCSVIYGGSGITEFLNSSGLPLNKINSFEIEINGERLPFKDFLSDTVSKKSSAVFSFAGLDKSFVLFHSMNGDKDTAVLGFDEEVDHIIRIEHKLEDSVKEIQCLYNVTKELQFTHDLTEAFERCVDHIRRGFSYPDETVVSLQVKDKQYGEKHSSEPDIRSILLQEIILNGKRYGEISVSLQNDKWFLKEEINLLKEIAGKISTALEKDEKQKNLEKQQKILLAKNEVLLRLTEDCNRNRQKLRTFFSAITDKIIVVDNGFNITLSNKEDMGDTGKCYEKMFGLNERCAECPAAEVFETGVNVSKERDESDKNYNLTAYPILGPDGEIDRVLEVCRDITTQKKMEAQLLQSYKLASLGKLVAGVAHEINNPNTFILGNLKIVEESFRDLMPILDEYYQKNLELKIARLNYNIFKENIPVLVHDMINGANRTKKIVSDLRNFAKKDEGLLTDDVDLNDIITNNLTLPAKHIKKHADLELDLGNGVPVFKGSINKLEQVLMNLIMNASEAIGAAEGKIIISTSFDAQKEEIVLSVSDNGCGIADSDKKNIFDPFYTTKRNSGGTGLGLSISYGIVKEHGGSIEVESKPGKGTKFTVRIPSSKQNDPKDTA